MATPTQESSFWRAWQRIAKEFCRRESDPNLVAKVREPDRQSEVDAVDGCVQRLVNAELATDDPRQPIGRSTKFGRPPGRIFRRQLARADDRVWHGVYDAINDSIMIGYFGMYGMEVDAKGPVAVVVDRSEEEIWRFWVPRISGNELKSQFGFSEPQVDPAEQAARQHLKAVFAAMGLLPRFGKRLKLELVANLYARAGIMLRLTQSDLVSAEVMATDPFGAFGLMWRYEDYSPIPARPAASVVEPVDER
jgi:hypothetical protein